MRAIEIIGDEYLISLGFTKGFINRNAVKMGSLRTRPRKFIKSEIENYLMKRAALKIRFKEPIPDKKRLQAYNRGRSHHLFDEVVKEFQNERR